MVFEIFGDDPEEKLFVLDKNRRINTKRRDSETCKNFCAEHCVTRRLYLKPVGDSTDQYMFLKKRFR